jgi:hypothetical protein
VGARSEEWGVGSEINEERKTKNEEGEGSEEWER